eukprot:scaffold10467_cov36-Tisochrysis_lutea.AAC.2
MTCSIPSFIAIASLDSPWLGASSSLRLGFRIVGGSRWCRCVSGVVGPYAWALLDESVELCQSKADLTLGSWRLPARAPSKQDKRT